MRGRRRISSFNINRTRGPDADANIHCNAGAYTHACGVGDPPCHVDPAANKLSYAT